MGKRKTVLTFEEVSKLTLEQFKERYPSRFCICVVEDYWLIITKEGRIWKLRECIYKRDKSGEEVIEILTNYTEDYTSLTKAREALSERFVFIKNLYEINGKYREYYGVAPAMEA